MVISLGVRRRKSDGFRAIGDGLREVALLHIGVGPLKKRPIAFGIASNGLVVIGDRSRHVALLQVGVAARYENLEVSGANADLLRNVGDGAIKVADLLVGLCAFAIRRVKTIGVFRVYLDGFREIANGPPEVALFS